MSDETKVRLLLDSLHQDGLVIAMVLRTGNRWVGVREIDSHYLLVEGSTNLPAGRSQTGVRAEVADYESAMRLFRQWWDEGFPPS